MGGAFIAVADDATAASWNPAGLIQLELPEISFVGATVHRNERITFREHQEASGWSYMSKNTLNYFSFAYPFTISDRNMIISANRQHLFDFTRNWDFVFVTSSETSTIRQNIRYEQEGSLSALGIAYSIEITPTFSFGITLNIWKDIFSGNEWEQHYFQEGTGTAGDNEFIFEYCSVEKHSFDGVNYNLGILWELNNRVTIGAVVKTPFKADVKREFSYYETTRFLAYPDANTPSPPPPVTEDETLDMPTSYGIGCAVRFSDKFTVSLDLYRTEWGEFTLTDASGDRSSPISNVSINESNIKPTHQIRLGFEYLLIDPKYVIPVRGGIFYDPAPAEGDPDDYFGFSVGSGIIVKRRFILDIAYQFRLGKNVGEYTMPNLGFSEDVGEHSLYSSLIVHF